MPRAKILPIATMVFATVGGTFLSARAAPHFNHIILIVQENRTPDNIFGSNPTFEPGVDIATNGRTSKGQIIPLTAVALDACYDIGHAHKDFEAMLTEGADKEKIRSGGDHKQCKIPSNPQFKFLDNSAGAIQPYFDIAMNYGFANRMFQTNQGPSFPAHQFLFGGTAAPAVDSSLFLSENQRVHVDQSGCLGDSSERVALIDAEGDEKSQKPIYPCVDHPTLTDVMEAALVPVTWRYYAPTPGSIWTAPDAISHICEAQGSGKKRACTGPDWTRHVVEDNPAQVLTDIGSCNLQDMSWVIPTADDSDHAGINKGLGPQWVAQIINAVGKQSCGAEGSYWNDTAIVVTWDDWGGWYDHVSPFSITAPPAWGAGYTYGFRVPLLVVSAYTSPGLVDDTTLDFGNILFFIEQNFGLGFIGPGYDAHTDYADYQAASRGALQEFFPLTRPRAFTPIGTNTEAKDFINAPKSNVGPDDD